MKLTLAILLKETDNKVIILVRRHRFYLSTNSLNATSKFVSSLIRQTFGKKPSFLFHLPVSDSVDKLCLHWGDSDSDGFLLRNKSLTELKELELKLALDPDNSRLSSVSAATSS